MHFKHYMRWATLKSHYVDFSEIILFFASKSFFLAYISLPAVTKASSLAQLEFVFDVARIVCTNISHKKSAVNNHQ